MIVDDERVAFLLFSSVATDSLGGGEGGPFIFQLSQAKLDVYSRGHSFPVDPPHICD